MPDLIELLDGAVDPPTTLDLEALGSRRARRHRRRRILQAATVVGVVLLAAGSLVAVRSGAHDGNDVEMPPVGDPDRPTTTDPDSPETTEAPTATTTTEARASAEGSTGTGTGNPLDPLDDDGSGPGGPGSAGSSGSSTTTTTAEQGLPACARDDISVVPSSDYANAQQVIRPGVSGATGGRPCTLDTTMTVTLHAYDPAGLDDGVLPIDDNPITLALSGTVGEGDGPDHDSLILSGCIPGADSGERGFVIVVVVIPGLANGSSGVTASACEDPQRGATFTILG